MSWCRETGPLDGLTVGPIWQTNLSPKVSFTNFFYSLSSSKIALFHFSKYRSSPASSSRFIFQTNYTIFTKNTTKLYRAILRVNFILKSRTGKPLKCNEEFNFNLLYYASKNLSRTLAPVPGLI